MTLIKLHLLEKAFEKVHHAAALSASNKASWT